MNRNWPIFGCCVSWALLSLASCGGAAWPECETCGGTSTTEVSESINTEKLIGTPFEGLTSGDNFPYYNFICDQYRTDSIDSFPIPIFLAFFTAEQEEIITNGVEIANQAIGFTAYEVTDTWSDLYRVIYKVDDIGIDEVIGHTKGYYRYFNGKIEAEKISPDWAIELVSSGINQWVVAHELGHATGIRSHALIDYENDTITDLEEGSIMESNGGYDSPTLNDYNLMMSMQGQIMLDHLGETGTLSGSDCDGLKGYYDSLEDEE